MGEFLFTFSIRCLAGAALGGIAGALIWRQNVLAELAEGRFADWKLLFPVLAGAVICVATTPRELWPWSRRRRRAREREQAAYRDPRGREAASGSLRRSSAANRRTVDRARAARVAGAEPDGRGPRHMRLEVTLPDGWREVPAEKGHAYRREHPGAGTLRLSLVPGSPDLVGDGAAALARLEQLQEEIDLELGKMLRSSHGRAASGVVAATVRKHPRHGIIAQWLLPLGKVMALGTYQMGSRETVKREVREANRIIATARFLEVEDSPLVG